MYLEANQYITLKNLVVKFNVAKSISPICMTNCYHTHMENITAENNYIQGSGGVILLYYVTNGTIIGVNARNNTSGNYGGSIYIENCQDINMYDIYLK